jgi:hypothetical protein
MCSYVSTENLNQNVVEIVDSHGGYYEDHFLMTRDFILFGNKIPTFCQIMLPCIMEHA